MSFRCLASEIVSKKVNSARMKYNWFFFVCLGPVIYCRNNLCFLNGLIVTFIHCSSSLFLRFERASAGSEAFSSGDNFSSCIFAGRGRCRALGFVTNLKTESLCQRLLWRWRQNELFIYRPLHQTMPKNNSKIVVDIIST